MGRGGGKKKRRKWGVVRKGGGKWGGGERKGEGGMRESSLNREKVSSETNMRCNECHFICLLFVKQILCFKDI